MVDHFYEPSYASGKAVPWAIGLPSGEPFGIACLWDRWIHPATGEQVASFTMLTVNADKHPVMRQFHRAEDEKRTPVVLDESQCEEWLRADLAKATLMMDSSRMPELTAKAAPSMPRS